MATDSSTFVQLPIFCATANRHLLLHFQIFISLPVRRLPPTCESLIGKGMDAATTVLKYEPQSSIGNSSSYKTYDDSTSPLLLARTPISELVKTRNEALRANHKAKKLLLVRRCLSTLLLATVCGFVISKLARWGQAKASRPTHSQE